MEEESDGWYRLRTVTSEVWNSDEETTVTPVKDLRQKLMVGKP